MLSSSVAYKRKNIILEIGKTLKAGYSGECAPRVVLETAVPLKHVLYKAFQILLSDYTDSVIVCEDILWSQKEKKAIGDAVHFFIKDVTFIPSCIAAVITTGSHHGLVIDIGSKETRVIPVYDCRVLTEHIAFLTMDIKSSLQTCVQPKSDARLLDCISDSDLMDLLSMLYSEQDQEFLWKNESMCIKSDIHNCLFGLNEDYESLATLVTKCVKQCPIDVKKPLCQNIVICGDLSNIHSKLKQNILEDVRKMNALAKEIRESAKFKNSSLLPWIGTSLYATVMSS
jgi:actin-related protein